MQPKETQVTWNLVTKSQNIRKTLDLSKMTLIKVNLQYKCNSIQRHLVLAILTNPKLIDLFLYKKFYDKKINFISFITQ